MHVQVVSFHLQGVARPEYEALCEQLAGAFAALPGLISKVWLADEATNTYGGVYLWRDRAAMEAFLTTDLFRGVATHPNLTDVVSRDFGVLEGPSAVTRAMTAAAA